MIDFKETYYAVRCEGVLKEYTYLSYNEFLKKYNESHRYFHTINHLEYIFNYLTRENPWFINDIIVLTIIFHDIVYYPHLTNNEKRSVKFFNSVYKYSADKTVKEEVITCILDTKDRKNITDYCKIFNEADISILYDDYKLNLLEYERNIRKEYSFLEFNEYKKNRIKILESLMDEHNKNNIDFLIEQIETNQYLYDDIDDDKDVITIDNIL